MLLTATNRERNLLAVLEGNVLPFGSVVLCVGTVKPLLQTMQRCASHVRRSFQLQGQAGQQSSEAGESWLFWGPKKWAKAAMLATWQAT